MGNVGFRTSTATIPVWLNVSKLTENLWNSIYVPKCAKIHDVLVSYAKSMYSCYDKKAKAHVYTW